MLGTEGYWINSCLLQSQILRAARGFESDVHRRKQLTPDVRVFLVTPESMLRSEVPNRIPQAACFWTFLVHSGTSRSGRRCRVAGGIGRPMLTPFDEMGQETMGTVATKAFQVQPLFRHQTNQ
jgi:hypothetical protein